MFGCRESFLGVLNRSRLSFGQTYSYRGAYSATTATTAYNGMGGVVQAEHYGALAYGDWAETFTSDVMGNSIRRAQAGMRSSPHPDYYGIRKYTYDSDGRLTGIADSAASAYYLDSTVKKYDAAGSDSLTYRVEIDAQLGTSLHDSQVHYYGPDDKLRVFNRHNGLSANSADSTGPSGVFEEYRYDALGRRVMVRSRHGPNCSSGTNDCAQYLEHHLGW